jgi:glutaminyl-peptide cyclotransferase
LKNEDYEILNSWDHDRRAFTEGLRFYDGLLYESLGLCGQSSVRQVELRTGKVLKEQLVEDVCNGEDCDGKACFGEGLTTMNGKVFQLTWSSQKILVYEARDLSRLGTFTCCGPGWGLTNDGTHLIKSDGTHELQFLDPSTFQVIYTVPVTHNSNPLDSLNELEYVKGEIYANTLGGPFGDFIARIDPQSGKVSKMVDLSKLSHRYRKNGVLNGIAHDEKEDRLFITGKQWPKLFEIRFKD